MTEHALIPAEKVRYPGGKDGWYRASCVCGRVGPFNAYPGRAEKAILDHVKAKTDGR